MGGLVDFRCRHCRYEETDIAFGRGRNTSPVLVLYGCDQCKTVGSTWVHANRVPRCAGCYHDAITVLADATRRVNCPKCAQPAVLIPKEGRWD